MARRLIALGVNSAQRARPRKRAWRSAAALAHQRVSARRLEGKRSTELAEWLGVTKQAAARVIDDLESVGVVARCRAR